MTKVAEEISQSQIWTVLDHLRSELPIHETCLVLAALIYLRWADFQEAEQEAIAAFDEVDYEPVLPAALHWRSWHAFPPQELQGLFADRLAPALERLNNSRHNPLATHLHRIASAVNNLGRLSPRSLEMLIHWLADQPFETPSDRRALLDVFDSILDKDFDPHLSEFRTPPSIVRLLVELATPAEGERIYDPCFGSAGLLTAANDYIRGQEKDRFSRSGTPAPTIFGIELNPSAYVIGLTRLALAGIGDPQLELGNSLERTPSNNPQRDGFDIVLADPPWSMRVDPEGLGHFPVWTPDATGLFIQHALAQLRPEGRAVIVVPEGFLFRSGSERKLRRILVERHTVEAVISLPAGVFLPYTGIKANVLLMRRDGPTKNIRMVDAESYFDKDKGRQSAAIQSDQAQKLAKAVRASAPSNNYWETDAASLAEVDWDFTPKRRDQSELLGILDSLRSEVEVHPLKACCKIMSGQVLLRDQLVDEPPSRTIAPEQVSLSSEENHEQGESPFDVQVIPYVRIRDVQRGQASKGSSWLSPAAAASVNAKWKLRAGDILLSKSGTIGKAGMVRNGAVGAIATTGLFVMRPDQDRLDPHFLLAYLGSSEVRAWLNDKARGATVQNLSKRVIDELPIPLPPLQIQQRTAAEQRDHGVDVLAFLARLLTEGERDLISEWIEKVDIDAISDPLDLSFLDQLATEVRSIRNEVAHSRGGESHLARWILQFNEATCSLQGIRNVPRGPGLFSVLQEAASGLKNVMQAIKGDLPSEAKARNMTKLIASWLDFACSALLDDVKLALSTNTGALHAGEIAEISLQIHNQGTLPLRDLKISTVPDWGESEFGYLAENAKSTINLTGECPKIAGIFTLKVTWSGSKLNGQQVNGLREIALSVLESYVTDAVEQADLGGSPYICGTPVGPDRKDVFFGRKELIDQIHRQIIGSGNVVLLEGNRRSGKSSILSHLEGANTVPGWLGVYCSFQGAEGSRDAVGVPTVEVFREISGSIAKALQTLDADTPLPNGTILPPGKKLGIARACREGILTESAFSDFRDYVEVVLEKLEEHDLGLLLMIDEFDKLQEGIDSGVTSPQVPENIRFLIQTYPRFSAILTGSRRLKRLREEYWSALFGIGTRFGVTALSEEAAHRLVTEPVKGSLTYSQESVEHAISLTAGQPYLLQCLCNRVFDMAAQLKIRSVTLDLVDQAGNALVEDNEHFANLWRYAGSDRRRFILALCHREASSPDLLRLGVIQERLAKHGVEVDDETLIADLDFLRELELIDRVGKSSTAHYVLTIPLMGMWIDKQQDFAALKSKAMSETEDQHE